MKRNRSPKQPCLYLHRNVSRIVGVPDPDMSSILHHAFVSHRLHFHGIEGACGCFDLFASFNFHIHRDGPHRICERKAECLPHYHRLRLRVENARERIRNACRNVGFFLRSCSFYEVALVLELLAVYIIERQFAGNLPAAFLNLLAEPG